jgi:hypothetical protein
MVTQSSVVAPPLDDVLGQQSSMQLVRPHAIFEFGNWSMELDELDSRLDDASRPSAMVDFHYIARAATNTSGPAKVHHHELAVVEFTDGAGRKKKIIVGCRGLSWNWTR